MSVEDQEHMAKSHVSFCGITMTTRWWVTMFSLKLLNLLHSLKYKQVESVSITSPQAVQKSYHSISFRTSLDCFLNSIISVQLRGQFWRLTKFFMYNPFAFHLTKQFSFQFQKASKNQSDLFI